MEEIKFYRCDICGNIITKIIDGGPIPFCCGQKMTPTAQTVQPRSTFPSSRSTAKS